MSVQNLRILHISDLHMRSVQGPQAARARREAAWRREVLGQAWSDNLSTLTKGGRPDLVVFTGDLGDWGDESDYPEAAAFLLATCAQLGVPLDRLFVVPGNHDVARDVAADAWASLRALRPDQRSILSDWMAGGPPRDTGLDSAWREVAALRQANFWRTVADALKRPQLLPEASPHGRLGYRVSFNKGELPIHIIGLDSSWLAGNEFDSGKLQLTEHQLAMLCSTDGDPLPGLRIALTHHPLRDLADAGRAQLLLSKWVDVLLHGHQHETSIDVLRNPDQRLLVLAAGCLFEGDLAHNHPNSHHVVSLDLDPNGRPTSADLTLRAWSSRGFWGSNSLLYRAAREGRLRMRRSADGAWSTVDPDEPPPRRRQCPAGYFVRSDLHELVKAALQERDGICVITGPRGAGKSAIARFFAARAAPLGGNVHFLAWPTRLCESEVQKADLVVIDNVELLDGEPAFVLDWIAQLPCPVLLTVTNPALAVRIHERYEGRPRTTIPVEPLSHAEALACLRTKLGEELFEQRAALFEQLLPRLGGLPFFIQILIDLGRVELEEIARGCRTVPDLQHVWVHKLRTYAPLRHDILQTLTCTSTFGTSPRLAAKVTGRDVNEIQDELGRLADEGLVTSPIPNEPYFVPHDLVREAFRDSTGPNAPAHKAQLLFDAVVDAESHNTGDSFVATMDVLVSATQRAFALAETGPLDRCIELLIRVEQNAPRRTGSTELVRWLGLWSATTSLDSCVNAIAISRMLQVAAPHEALANLVVREIEHKDTYAALEALLATIYQSRALDDTGKQRVASTIERAAKASIRDRSGPLLGTYLFGALSALARVTTYATAHALRNDLATQLPSAAAWYLHLFEAVHFAGRNNIAAALGALPCSALDEARFIAIFLDGAVDENSPLRLVPERLLLVARMGLLSDLAGFVFYFHGKHPPEQNTITAFPSEIRKTLERWRAKKGRS